MNLRTRRHVCWYEAC